MPQPPTILFYRLYSVKAPRLNVRWFYATDIPTTKPTVKTYIQKHRARNFLPFSELDSRCIETQFQKYKASGGDTRYQLVPVHEDQLFDCDLKARQLRPAYWSGPSYEIRRGTWFVDGSPVSESIADQLERAYSKIKPYDRVSVVDADEGSGQELSACYESDCLIVPETDLYKKRTGKDWPFQDPPDLCCNAKAAVFIDGHNAVLFDPETGSRKIFVDAFAKSLKKGIMGCYCLTRGVDEDNSEAQNKEEENKQDTKSVKTTEAAIPETLSSAMEMVQSLKKTLDYEFSNERFQKDMEGDFANDPSLIENSGDREVDHLILCVHGIGQSLSSKFSGVNFAHDCSNLRRLLKTLFKNDPEKYGKLAYPSGTDLSSTTVRNCKVQVLPIVWRYDIDFSWDHVYDGFAEDGSLKLPKLSELKIDGVTSLRTLAADVVLDLLLYYEPSFKKQILDSVIRSANGLYDKYMERHPNFKGKVSLCGHSLGSVIALDVLCSQPLTPPKEEDFDPSIHLKFPVENYFGMGSPNGVFKLMKRQNIRPRDRFEATADDPLSLISGPTLSPKVRNVYNIFYPTDIVAYRIEPLVHTTMAKYEPKSVEFANRNFIYSKIQSLSNFPAGILNSDMVKSVVKMTGLDSQYEKALQTATEAAESEEKEIELPQVAQNMMRSLNKNGRIDYSLPQSYFEIDIVNALGSHTQYLSDPDVANFLLQELWSTGEESIKGTKKRVETPPT
ncbi:hypothetical protein FOA43_000839 [Brettanomyces nanus]|uniref:DDHD domain-containing protein n=1 Tax=Eeniella nana TaxID=13502 RepID=A0A875RXY5_EENNA|nr:uncharacterized protein FOA43_000839 [Brettanomyces nanus]QPG73528.1 hypothetical protein FOA43_000839 [Brettanomyces nanus]